MTLIEKKSLFPSKITQQRTYLTDKSSRFFLIFNSFISQCYNDIIQSFFPWLILLQREMQPLLHTILKDLFCRTLRSNPVWTCDFWSENCDFLKIKCCLNFEIYSHLDSFFAFKFAANEIFYVGDFTRFYVHCKCFIIQRYQVYSKEWSHL